MHSSKSSAFGGYYPSNANLSGLGFLRRLDGYAVFNCKLMSMYGIIIRYSHDLVLSKWPNFLKYTRKVRSCA